jgi:hemolysin activation/secretion protein
MIKSTLNKSRANLAIAGIVFAFYSTCSFADAASPSPGPIERFEITRYDVQGNTLLTTTDIDQMLNPYTGKDKDFGSVQVALETLEAAYRAKGYDLVRVNLPEQELNHGVVILKVTEFKVGKIRVSGNRFFTDANIKNSLPALQEGQIPVMRDISSNVKVANEDPSKKVTVEVQSASEEGLVNALLKVEDQKPWTVSVGVDDTGDEVTGRNRLTVVYQNANIGGWDHVLSMQYTTSFAHPEDVNVYGIGYHIPLYTLTDSLDFYASYSNVNSGTVTAGVFDLAVSGSGTVAGMRYNHNILKAGNYDSTLSGGIDYKIYNNDLSVLDTPIGGDVVVHPFFLTYAGNWAITGSALNFSVSAARNIPGGNNSDQSDFNAARAGATPNYSLARFAGSFLKTLPLDWQFRANLTGQLSSDALVPGEEFGIGGVNSVRGFIEREVAGDKGEAGSLELYTFNLCGTMAQCRLLGFYDAGHVTRNDALPGEIVSQSISSSGLGVRFSRAPDWLFQADIAHVIDGSTTTPKGTNRADFKLMYTF